MVSVSRAVRDEYQRNFVKLFESLCGKYSRWEVWADFVLMSAVAISNTVDKVHAGTREDLYMTASKKYTGGELESLSAMLGNMVQGMDGNQDQDFLGEIFMVLGLGNDRNGQFFTPYSVCRMMAKMECSQAIAEVESKGWISCNDCACGAGALLVAFANECKENNINYKTSVLFTAQDIDYTTALCAICNYRFWGARDMWRLAIL